jgi:thiol-disulfide isomerase/thioredoxin
MNPIAIIGILVGLVAVATALGLVWRARTGRVRSVSARAGGEADVVALPEVPLRGKATLLQFSTEVCAPCVPTRRVLAALAEELDDVQHVDLDVTHRPELASRFNILQTPTTLILDRRGVVRARIGGAPRGADVREALERILAA